jgi:hypothetical protein
VVVKADEIRELSAQIGETACECLVSQAVLNSNGDAANLADVVHGLVRATRAVADSITPSDAAPGHDATGGTVASLTEAVMGVTAGLYAIASAIGELAGAVRDGRR